MPYDTSRHQRRSIRLKDYDYSQAGAYFVTLVTWQREFLFGEIANDEIQLGQFGHVAVMEMQKLPQRFGNIELDAWVVMPNHVHAVIVITEMNSGGVGARQIDPSMTSGVGARQIDPSMTGGVGARQEEPSMTGEVGARQIDPSMTGGVGARLKNDSHSGNLVFASPLHGTSPLRGTLGAVIGAYKSTTARIINGLRRTPGSPVWQRNYFEHIVRDENEMNRIRAYIQDNPRRWAEDAENPNVS